MITLKKSKRMAIKNYNYFKKHLRELNRRYGNKFIVLKDCRVIGAYDTFDDAYKTTIKSEQLGTFIIQKIF